MNMRKDNAISLKLNLQEIDPEQRIMRFMLQPLCENAIQHGLTPHKLLHIDVTIRKVGTQFIVIVKNDGTMIEAWMIEEIMDKVRHRQGENGVGLANIYSRIKLLYGESSDLIIESGEKETSIILKLGEANDLKIS